MVDKFIDRDTVRLLEYDGLHGALRILIELHGTDMEHLILIDAALLDIVCLDTQIQLPQDRLFLA